MFCSRTWSSCDETLHWVNDELNTCSACIPWCCCVWWVAHQWYSLAPDDELDTYSTYEWNITPVQASTVSTIIGSRSFWPIILCSDNLPLMVWFLCVTSRFKLKITVTSLSMLLIAVMWNVCVYLLVILQVKMSSMTVCWLTPVATNNMQVSVTWGAKGLWMLLKP